MDSRNSVYGSRNHAAPAQGDNGLLCLYCGTGGVLSPLFLRIIVSQSKAGVEANADLRHAANTKLQLQKKIVSKFTYHLMLLERIGPCRTESRAEILGHSSICSVLL